MGVSTTCVERPAIIGREMRCETDGIAVGSTVTENCRTPKLASRGFEGEGSIRT